MELPLAARTILAGVRVATVTTIGTATIAAAIGGGGLGVFIFRGIASVDTTQILAGAVPAALLALDVGWGIGLDRKTFLGCLSYVRCRAARAERRITVGSKNFTEQVILGELIAQQIENHLHQPVDRKLNLGGMLLAHQALLSKDLDLYPEYTGTAFANVLKCGGVTDPAVVFERVRAEYGRMQLEWLDPLGFNSSFAMTVRGEDARSQHLETLSDAAADTGRIRARLWLRVSHAS